MIYIIKKIWIAPMEDLSTDAVGYEVIGYVKTEEEAQDLISGCRVFNVNDCWAIKGQMLEYMWESFPELDTSQL